VGGVIGTDQWLGVRYGSNDELEDMGMWRLEVELGHSGMELLGGVWMVVWVTMKGEVMDVFASETDC
jgi:hypothetical protein